MRNFKDIWEKQETACLTRDRDRKLELLAIDPDVAAQQEEMANNEINERVDGMKIPGEYFTPDSERILFQEDLQEVEFI